MTELLSADDKVQIDIQDESVTVPAGKVWKVVIISSVGEITLYHANNDRQETIVDEGSTGVESQIEVTLHEEEELEAPSGNIGFIRGWEFDYK